jgi:hypothetical protein
MPDALFIFHFNHSGMALEDFFALFVEGLAVLVELSKSTDSVRRKAYASAALLTHEGVNRNIQSNMASTENPKVPIKARLGSMPFK